MGTANHRVNVVRINELEKHPNADSLSIVRIEGYQIVVKTENWKIGDLGIYIQPDSVVPQIPQFFFLWEDRLKGPDMCQHEGSVLEYNGIKHCSKCQANIINGQTALGEKYRRITVRRFRKEYSEGLLLPLTDFPEVVNSVFMPSGSLEGMDVSSLIGITHYEPPEDPQQTGGDNERAPGSRQNKVWPRSLKGWYYFLIRVLTFGLYDPNGNVGGSNTKAPSDFRSIYDVENIKNFRDVLQEGEQVIATEKIHGSNARFTFADGKMYAGSRKLWKAPTSKCIWRKALEQHQWITDWCFQHPGYTLYGEIVPTQKGFNYGCKDGEVKFFVFDVLRPDGSWVQRDEIDSWPDNDLLQNWVPDLYEGPFGPVCTVLVDGKSVVDNANHIREGIVIRPVLEREAKNLGRVQLKVVSNTFLEKDSK